MKKGIVLFLIILGISLPLGIYLYINSTLREFKIDDKDSKTLKKYKVIYNNDLRLLNKEKLQKELINCYEEESKKNKKDLFNIIQYRVLFNNLKYENSQYDKDYIESLEKNYNKKILDTEEEKKKRKILKITFCDLNEEENLKEKSKELRKDNEINEFSSEYNKLFEENEKIFLDNYNMTGEEFLKLNYKEKWINYLKKQTNILKNMRNKIKNLSKEKKEIKKNLEAEKKDLGVQIKPIIDKFEKEPFNVEFKKEKTSSGINKYIGRFKDEYGIVLELEGNMILKNATLKISETLIKEYKNFVKNKNSKYIEDVSFELIDKVFQNSKISTKNLLVLIGWQRNNAYIGVDDEKICVYYDEQNDVREFRLKLRTKEEFDEIECQGYEIKEDKFLNFKKGSNV